MTAPLPHFGFRNRLITEQKSRSLRLYHDATTTILLSTFRRWPSPRRLASSSPASPSTPQSPSLTKMQSTNMSTSKVSCYVNSSLLHTVLTVLQVCTPKKQETISIAMAAPYGSPSRAGLTVRSQSLDPFEVLTAVVDAPSDGSGSSGSPTSSGGSFSCIGRNESTGAPATPSRGQAQGRMLSAVQQLVSILELPHHCYELANWSTGCPRTISTTSPPPVCQRVHHAVHLHLSR